MNSKLILSIIDKIEDLTFVVQIRLVVCARALLVFLVVCACSLLFNAIDQIRCMSGANSVRSVMWKLE